MGARIWDVRVPRTRGARIGLWIRLIVVAVLLASAGSFFAYFAYCNWQADRAVRQAKSSFASQKLQEGILRLQAALRRCPNHLEARRTVASLLEASRSAEALVHRRKLMDLQPRLLEPKLAYARAALLFDKPQEAAKVLDGIKGLNRRTSEFLELRAEQFLARARTDLALEVYRELLELHPEDRRIRAKLAALELQNGPEQVRDSARAALESLASDEEFGAIALRALTKDALRRQDLPAALSWSGRASETPSVEFFDRMLRLQALFAAKSSGYDSWLSDVEKRAFENPRFALELGKWKVTAIGLQRAAAWLESAPKSIQDDPATGALLADCYSALDRWNDLESLTRSSAWRELDPLRLAFLARAQARQGNLKKSEQTWKLAVAAAEKQPEQLVPLLAMARDDKRDVRQVLWVIAEKGPGQLSARRELYQAYWQERNADGMLRMMELVLKEKPNDRAAKFNVASLLMATGRQIKRAGGLAKELYEDDPQVLGNAALYAFGLYLQGDPEKGADLFDSREDLELLGSDGAAYYALVLSACGRGDEARQLLVAVDRQALLPELCASLDRAFGTAPTNAAILPMEQ
jgi:tetratricopeptide (TPR) repeat protein